jgi:hypothetical protein
MFGGEGDDFIYAADGIPKEAVDCGPGAHDTAYIDKGDVAVNCENH